MNNPLRKNGTKKFAKLSAFWEHRPDVVLLTILAAAYAVFIPSLFNSFVNWDDNIFVLNNPLIYAVPFTNFKAVLFSHFLGVGLYYPLTILCFQIEHFFFQLYAPAFHLVNLLLHLFNIALVFYILQALRLNWKICGLVALLFGIHPLQVESVAWISSLKDLLYVFFYLSAVLFYLKESQARMSLRAQIILSLLFLLALSSKITAISLPFTLLLLDYFRRRKLTISDGASKLPLFLLMLLFVGINLFTIYLDHACPASGSTTQIDRIWLSGNALGLYLFKLIFPHQLSVIYPVPIKWSGYFPQSVYLSALLVLIFLGWFLKKFLRNSSVFLPFAFFLLTLAPGLHLFKMSNCLIYERYVYLPSLGIFILLSLGYFALLTKAKNFVKFLLVGAGIIYLVFLGCSTWFRCGVWKNGGTLWTDTIKKFPNSSNAYSNRAAYYLETQEYLKGLADADKSINLNPNLAEFYMLRGDLYERLEMLPQTLADYNEALRLGMVHPSEQRKLINNRGNIYSRLGKDDLALADYSQVLKLDPHDLFALLNRGLVHAQYKRWDLAIADFETALKLDPNNSFAAENLKKFRKKSQEKH